MKWLNKWDEFRSIKAQYADRALEILKRKRRVTNLIALMGLVRVVTGVRENVDLLTKHNMRIWA